MDDDNAFGDDALRDANDAVDRDRYDLAHAGYHLARLVAGLKGSGKVVAVNARWGGGKTSLVNLTEPFFLSKDDRGGIGDDPNKLRRYRPKRCPEDEFNSNVAEWRCLGITFVRFNAWLEGGEEGIALAIIDTIDDTLADPGKARSLARKITRHVLRNPEQYFKGGMKLANVATAGFAGGVIEAITPNFAGGANLENKIEKLIKTIVEKNRRLVIVIDDIDRMPPERIQALIAALWWVRELPLVNFLLLYDRDQVVDSLARTMFRAADGAHGKHSGKDSATRFLEKIVQYSFDVPQPARDQLLDALENDLKKIGGDSLPGRAAERFEGEPRWTAIRKYILRELVNTPRAVKRLTWTVGISWPMRRYIDVDFRDLVAIEAVRLFNPEVFEEIEEMVGKIERGDEVAEKWDPGAKSAKSMIAVLMPAHFRKSEDRALESAEEIAKRRGFGTPRLMSHYLQGVPHPGVAVLYNLEDFFHERSADFRETLIQAAKEDNLRPLCAAIGVQAGQRSIRGRTLKQLAEELRAAANSLGARDSLVAKLNEQAEIVDD